LFAIAGSQKKHSKKNGTVEQVAFGHRHLSSSKAADKALYDEIVPFRLVDPTTCMLYLG